MNKILFSTILLSLFLSSNVAHADVKPSNTKSKSVVTTKVADKSNKTKVSDLKKTKPVVTETTTTEEPTTVVTTTVAPTTEAVETTTENVTTTSEVQTTSEPKSTKDTNSPDTDKSVDVNKPVVNQSNVNTVKADNKSKDVDTVVKNDGINVLDSEVINSFKDYSLVEKSDSIDDVLKPVKPVGTLVRIDGLPETSGHQSMFSIISGLTFVMGSIIGLLYAFYRKFLG